MSHHFDPMEKAMQDAEQKVISAGLSGGDVHATVDQGTVMMATMSWAVREIKESNQKLAKELMGGDDSVRGRIKKNGPAASIGALIVGAVAYLKDFLTG
jgi:hypothetical protein